MSELSEEQLTEKFQQFVGTSTGKSIYRVKGKKIVAYAKSIGVTDPKYVEPGKTAEGKTDYSTIVAYPSFPASFTINTGGPLYGIEAIVHDDGRKVITNIGKLLHTAQEYIYTDECIPIKDGMKTYTTGEISKIWVKAGLLWMQMSTDTKTKDGKLLVKSIASVGIRRGGWQ